MSGAHLERVKCDRHTCNLMLGIPVLTSGQGAGALLKGERSEPRALEVRARSASSIAWGEE